MTATYWVTGGLRYHRRECFILKTSADVRELAPGQIVGWSVYYPGDPPTLVKLSPCRICCPPWLPGLVGRHAGR